MRIAVTGATGYLGQFVVDDLLSRGHQVAATTQCLSSPRDLKRHTRLHWFEWRLGDRETTFEFLHGCGALVHGAFHHIEGRYRGGEGDDVQGFLQTNLMGTVELLLQARSYSINRTVFVSSRAVFGQGGEDSLQIPIPDDVATFPDTLYGSYKAVIESLSSEFLDIGLCSIRPTGIYGVIQPRTRSKWYDLCHNATAVPSTAEDDLAKTEVHGEDVAKAIHILLAAPAQEVVGKSFNCSDVAVSRTQIVYMIDQLKQANHSATLATSLPKATEPRLPMASDGLARLGWQKSGMAKVISTLYELMNH